MDTADRLVSIIVPVYNAGRYIKDTMQMVEKQTYQNFELILIDDCSTDNSRQIIREYMASHMGNGSGSVLESTAADGKEYTSGKIRLIEKEVNGGAAMARNIGMDAAGGRYIAFLDADDVWMPDKLEKELTYMEEKQAAFVCTSYEFGDEKARGTGKIVHVPKILTYKQALSRTVIFTTTVLLDTSKTGRELIHMPEVKSEDTALWWKLLKNGFTAYGLDEVLAIYRRPGKSLSSNKLEAMKRIWNLYRSQEGLSRVVSAWYFTGWAFRATLRRL